MMNKAATVVLIFAVFGTAQADIWGSITGWASDVANFFKNSFTKFEDLFASDETTLEKNVNKTLTLLNQISSEKGQLMTVANTTQQAALNRVDFWIADLKTFAANISMEGAAKFATHNSIWKAKLQSMFQTDNIQTLLPLINAAGPIVVSLTALFLSLGIQFYLNY